MLTLNEFFNFLEKWVVEKGEIILSQNNLKDIGTNKSWVTEFDLSIEKEFRDMIILNFPDHSVLGEEYENKNYTLNNTWIIDPISGTRTLLEGLPNYAIVIAFVSNGVAQFGLVYDPTLRELYTAKLGKGSYKNGRGYKHQIMNNNIERLIFSASYHTEYKNEVDKIFHLLIDEYEIYRTKSSTAVNIVHTSEGRFDTAVILSKDTYPIFAAGLIATESGLIFTNLKKETRISTEDKIFVCTTKNKHTVLIDKLTKSLSE
jgi:myo-inositol-1(or 4)-monophosphatase